MEWMDDLLYRFHMCTVLIHSTQSCYVLSCANINIPIMLIAQKDDNRVLSNHRNSGKQISMCCCNCEIHYFVST